MGNNIQTYGEFIDYIKGMEFTGVEFYLEDWMALATSEEWKEYRKMPLTDGLVRAFAQDMKGSIHERLSGICTDALYRLIYDEGHAFLRAVHELAVEAGIDMGLRDVDLPITPSDIMVEAGYVGIDDRGNIIPKI